MSPSAQREHALRLLRATSPMADESVLESLLGSREDLHTLQAALIERFPQLKLGQRKRLELSLRSLPRSPTCVSLTEGVFAAPIPLRLAWLHRGPPGDSEFAASLLVGDDDHGDRRRASQASACIAGGALLARHRFSIRAGDLVVGHAEYLIVYRCPATRTVGRPLASHPPDSRAPLAQAGAAAGRRRGERVPHLLGR